MNTLPVIFTPLSQDLQLPQKPVRVIGIGLGTTNLLPRTNYVPSLTGQIFTASQVAGSNGQPFWR